MEFDPINISKLEKLGLTEIQAKIYLIMLSLGKEKASTIAKIANVDRSNVYKAIDNLQKQKIISKLLGSPNLYQASPLEEVLELLIKAKSDQFTESLMEAEYLKKSLIDSEKQIQNNEYEFGDFRIKNYSKIAHLKGISVICKNAQKNIDLLVNKKTFIGGVVLFPKPHLRCLKRGIKYRLITEHLGAEYINKELNHFLKVPNFEIRFINYVPLMEVCVTDNKWVSLSLVPDKAVGKAPFLTTSNVGFAEIVSNHFDTVWKKAKK